MSLFTNLVLPETPDVETVCRYLTAMHAKDFARADTFFDADIRFNGLILKAQGRGSVAQEMAQFVSGALDDIRIEAIAQVEAGSSGRVLVLYWFKMKNHPEYQAIADHITLKNHQIVQIDNVFDVNKVQM